MGMRKSMFMSVLVFTLNLQQFGFRPVSLFDLPQIVYGVFLALLRAFQASKLIKPDSINDSTWVEDKVPAEVDVARRALFMAVRFVKSKLRASPHRK